MAWLAEFVIDSPYGWYCTALLDGVIGVYKLHGFARIWAINSTTPDVCVYYGIALETIQSFLC